MKVVMILLVFSSLSRGETLTGWENLNCQPGHKYLFSETELSWYEAREECELYGGWLLSLGSRQEQNCLLSHAQDKVRRDWFWHDGEDGELTVSPLMTYVQPLTGMSEESISTPRTGPS